MSKRKNILLLLILAVLLICYAGCSRHGDNIITNESQSNSTEDSKLEDETKGIDAFEHDTSASSSISGATLATKGSEETTEASFEGNTSEETEGSTEQESSTSGSTDVTTTEAPTRTQGSTKPVQPTTAAPKPTEAPVQPTTAAPKPTEAPTQAPTEAPKPTQAPTQAPTEAPTEAPKPAYDPNYVIAETTRQLKAAGYECIPEYLDRYLAEGRITQEEYNAWYPTDGAGWFECSLYNVTFGLTIEDDVYEIVERCKYLCVDNIFYIEYIGENEYGGYTFRVYR